MAVLAALAGRGLLHNHTPNIARILDSNGGGVYLGIDPTASSLHTGHLLGIITLERIARATQLRPIVLVGGATGMIGDPSGRTTERALLSADVLEQNVSSLKRLIHRMLGERVVVVNNMDWYKQMTAIELIRDVGRHFRVGSMLARDSVKARMGKQQHHDDAEKGSNNNSHEGISYTEFSYQLFQSHDFFHLHQTQGVALQIGGSDQWGNITAGCEYVRKRHGGEAEVAGLTFPLLTDVRTGLKLGKSAGNVPVWLDAAKTPPFHFYQFFLSLDDKQIPPLLNSLTFLPDDEIAAIVSSPECSRNPFFAHAALAAQVTSFVHGAEAVASAQHLTELLFSKQQGVESISKEHAEVLLRGDDVKTVRSDSVETIVDLCVAVDVGGGSRREIRRLIEGRGLSINGRVVTDATMRVKSNSDCLHGGLIVLRIGKRSLAIVNMT